jgi:hypothetical protein
VGPREGTQGFHRLRNCTVRVAHGDFLLYATRLLYYPSRSYLPLSEAQANSAFREFSVRTSDGIDLKAWYAPVTTKPFTIVFFHGNADSLYAAAQIANPYIA